MNFGIMILKKKLNVYIMALGTLHIKKYESVQCQVDNKVKNRIVKQFLFFIRLKNMYKIKYVIIT